MAGDADAASKGRGLQPLARENRVVIVRVRVIHRVIIGARSGPIGFRFRDASQIVKRRAGLIGSGVARQMLAQHALGLRRIAQVRRPGDLPVAGRRLRIVGKRLEAGSIQRLRGIRLIVRHVIVGHRHQRFQPPVGLRIRLRQLFERGVHLVQPVQAALAFQQIVEALGFRIGRGGLERDQILVSGLVVSRQIRGSADAHARQVEAFAAQARQQLGEFLAGSRVVAAGFQL